MTLEQTLLEVTKVNPKKFKDRQKLLASVARVAVKLPDEQWDALPDTAMAWIEDAAKAIKAKKEVPDFPDAEAEEVEEIEIEYEPEEAEPPREPDDANEGYEPAEEAKTDDAEAEEAEEQETAEAAAADGSYIEVELDTVPIDEREIQPEPAAPAKKPKKAKAKKEPKPKKVKKERGEEPPLAPRYANITGSKNRYGIIEGTILDDVIKMMEAGCTQTEIKAKFGDTKYNLERRLKDQGHVFVLDGAKRTLIHRDDVEVEAKPKGKKK